MKIVQASYTSTCLYKNPFIVKVRHISLYVYVPDGKEWWVGRGGGLHGQLPRLLHALSIPVDRDQSHEVGGAWQTVVDDTAAVLLRQLHLSLL